MSNVESEAVSKPKSEVLRKMSTSKPDESKEKECSLQKVTKTIVSSPHIYAPVGPYSNNNPLLAMGLLQFGGYLPYSPQLTSAVQDLIFKGNVAAYSLIYPVVGFSDTRRKSRELPGITREYSQAILADKTLYVSGVLGMDKEGQLVCGGAEKETRQVLENMKHVLEAGGASLASVIKVTILLADMQDFKIVNQVYSEYFPRDYPARATYQVAKLPKDAAIEIECIALSGDLVVAEAGPCPCSRV